jgi:hypothetical protein
LLSFPPGTEMVHFPGFASHSLLYSGVDIPILLGILLKDSEIPRSQPVCGSLRLIAAYHVLLRLPSPRHPPYALSSLTIKFTLPEIFEKISAQAFYGLLDFFTRRYLIVKEQNFRTSTGNQGLARQAFDFQHTPNRMVEVSGLEPLTPCLQSRCSSS